MEEEKNPYELLTKRAGLLLVASLWIITAPVSPVLANETRISSLNIREEFQLATPGAAVAVIWSADGSALAAASNYGQVLTVWDRAGHLINQIKRIGGGPTLGGSIAFAHGSSQLVFPPPATASKSTAFAVWDVSTGHIIRTVDGPQPGDDYSFNVADHFMTTPDQTMLATATLKGASSPHFQKNVSIYETGSWRVLHTAALSQGASSLCVFADGQLIGAGSVAGGRVSIIDAKTGVIVEDFQAYKESKYGSSALGAIAGSPAGDLIMVGVSSTVLNGGEYLGTPEQRAWGEAKDSTEAVQLFRVKDGTRVSTFSAAKGPIRQAMWDPKGRFVAFVDNQRGLFLWAPWISSDYKKIHLPTRTLALAISPNGDRIAATTDHGVSVYSINDLTAR
jgi:WD40 repeat protein